jgi:hypothetical protein
LLSSSGLNACDASECIGLFDGAVDAGCS